MVEEGQQSANSLQTEAPNQGVAQPAEAPPVANQVDMPETDAALLLNQAQQAMASIDEITPDLPSGTKPFELKNFVGTPASTDSATLELIQDIPLDLKIELGRTHMQLEDVLQLKKGAVVTLDKLTDDPVDIYVNGRLIARGEVLVLNDNFCVRVTELIAGKSAVA
jgi:flagellar motor switch protein FliN/FliY